MASLADRVEAIERSRPTDAPALPSSADAASSIAPEALVASRVPQVSGASDSPATELDTPAPTPSLLPSGLSTASSDATTPRLPAAPAPLEDFAQRDPSLRSELLADMGGNAETEKAVGRALEWLRRHQEREGHWSSRRHGGEVDADAAMTGLALLTFLGAGHTHQAEGPYRETVARGLEWLRARQRSDGDLRHASGATAGAPRSGSTGSDTMYGQTIATVALCEAYAMTRDASLAPAARSAIQFVLARAADAQRGRASAQDTAVLGWLVMTIETARRAGFAPPTEIFRQAQQWLDGIAVSRDGGRYAYRPGERSSPAMTAEAMFVQQLVGRTAREPRMAESAEYLLTAPPRWSSDAPTHHWYYATLALFQHQGEPWERWNEALTRELLAHQRSDGTMDGSWDPQDRWSRAGGRVYQTAVCALSLEVYYRYRVPTQREVTLPSEQRSRQPRPE